jgi:hypothetical protein
MGTSGRRDWGTFDRKTCLAQALIERNSKRCCFRAQNDGEIPKLPYPSVAV